MAMTETMRVKCKFCGGVNTKKREERTSKCRACGKTTVYGVIQEEARK